ncbi:conserved hypothetical protein, partial [Trichinella spiralis]|uniref:hypothetical protein n=1 Tax=Trichinella spiralis TaxID=6334 RepID=UPI0001EFD6B0
MAPHCDPMLTPTPILKRHLLAMNNPWICHSTKQSKHHHQNHQQQQRQQPELTTTTNDDKEASNLLAFVQREGQRITQTMQQARLVPSYGCELVSPTETRVL